MADAKTTDDQQPGNAEIDDELIPVEEQPDTEGADEDDDGDEDEGDERLAESEDDSDEDIASGSKSNRDRRKKRRDMQRRAKEAAERKIAMLERQNAEMLQRLQAVEGFTQNTNAQTLEARIAQSQREIQQAEMIIAKATEAGNGDDVVAAMRIRDQAIANAQQLATAKQQFDAQLQQAQQPRVDPNVVNYAKQWMEANPWYDPSGRDRDSALTKAIDNELAAEGFDPASRDYWEELTARVADALGETESKPKRKAPPTGRTREHAPVSTKKEIYVTPERKQAMIEAGVWDDPVLRQRYLKAYQAYDTSSAR
jgi:hypothetical protein